MQDAPSPPEAITDRSEPADAPVGLAADTEADPRRDEEVPASRRGGRTGRDMAISLVVLLIPLAIIVGLFRLRGGEDTVVVDPSTAIGQAQAAGAFPVAAPKGLGAGWTPVSAQFRTEGSAALRVGYLTPSGGQVQLIESNEDAGALLARELGAGSRLTGTVPVGGEQWQTYQVRVDETALVLSQPARTVIIIGRAKDDELTTLAAALS